MNLPPGQRARPDFPRFGLSKYADRIPDVPERPTLVIDGLEGDQGVVYELAELAKIPRREQTSDLHCVTSWSATDQHWSGWSLVDVLEAWVPDLIRAHRDAESNGGQSVVIVASGMDGFKGRLTIEDALDPSVMLVDRHNGEPLGLDHGAPLRLIAPRHYGYKHVKHLKALRFRRRGEEGLGYGRLAFLEHLRGRVEFEERGGLPGRLLRYLYRPFINSTVKQFNGALRAHADEP